MQMHPKEQQRARCLLGWRRRWLVLSRWVFPFWRPVEALTAFFTYVMAGEVATICRRRFKNEARMETRRMAGGIAGISRGRHEAARSHTYWPPTRGIVGTRLRRVKFFLCLVLVPIRSKMSRSVCFVFLIAGSSSIMNFA